MIEMIAGSEEYLARAEMLAAEMGTSCRLMPEDVAALPEVYLLADEDGLSLVSGSMKSRGDFSQMYHRIRPGRWQHEMLVKAAKMKGVEHPTAVDCTAGLGEDSILLAAAGFEVTMYERDPVIAAMLADALQRAARDPELLPAVSRMHLAKGDSTPALHRLAEESRASSADGCKCAVPDVIYLDPMFPKRQKSALVGKKFQLLHYLEKPACDEEELLDAALAVKPHKIVIKRPLLGPYLAGRTPTFSHRGKAIRYDVIVLA